MNRYGIDSSRRTKHGALLDSELLAEVYAELCGGKQTALSLTMVETTTTVVIEGQVAAPLQRPRPLAPRRSAEEAAAHAAFIATLGENAIWNEYTAGS